MTAPSAVAPVQLAPTSRGFTLIELLVTVVILTVLTSVAVPVLLGQKAKAEDAAAQSNIAAIAQVVNNGFGANAAPTVSGGSVSYTSASGTQEISLGSATAEIYSVSNWCVEQLGGSAVFHMGPGMNTPQSGDCIVTPAPPSSLIAEAVDGTSDSIHLSWAPPADPLGIGGVPLGMINPFAIMGRPLASNGTITYTIKRNGAPIDSTSNMSYTATGLEPDTEYAFAILAVNSTGPSLEVAATARTHLLAPAPPSNVNAAATGATTTHVTWDAAARAVSYTILRDNVEIATGVSGTSFDDTGLTADTVYSYKVRGVNPGGQSSLSDSSTATTDSLFEAVMDLAFIPPPGINNSVETVAQSGDGKLYIGGNWFNLGVNQQYFVARLDANGPLDTGFNPSVVHSSGAVSDIAIQSDGKVVIVGNFVNVAGDPALDRLVRLNVDGTLDSGFTPPNFGDYSPGQIELVDGGKLLVAGDFTSVNGDSARRNLVRLNTDGTVDSAFNHSGASQITTMLVQPGDSKIVVAGSFSAGGRSRLVRLNSDGSTDTSFTPPAGLNGKPYALALQSDNKIVVGGAFTDVANVLTRDRLIRVNDNGSLDTGFTAPDNLNSTVYSVAVLPDGKVAAGGAFTDAAGNPALDRLVLLNSDGSLANAYEGVEIANGYVMSLLVQADGKVVVGGSFDNAGGVAAADRMFRLK